MKWLLIILFFGEANTGYRQENVYPMPDRETCERSVKNGAMSGGQMSGPKTVVAVAFCVPQEKAGG